MLCEWISSLDAGDRTPRQLLDLCLDRVRSHDADVQAWVAVDPQPATGSGGLNGIPFGAKDIFDTAILPTAFGSPLYAGNRPGADAALVAMLRSSGGVLLGKTHTAAFAYFDPPPTRNPRAPGRTPGGSSSGSAAAVAAGMVPFAIGSQTQGSVLRPASYCGVAGFKPSFGLLPTAGALPFAPSLDTVGFFTQTVADMDLLWRRGFGGGVTASLLSAARMRLNEEEPMRRVVDRAVALLRAAGVPVEEIAPPSGFDRLGDAARLINDYEGARSHQERWRQFGDRIGVKLAAMVQRGLAIPGHDYQAALEHVQTMKARVGEIFWEYPLLLAPAATGPAPEGLAATGDPAANAPWTALGLPALSIPMPVQGPPLGLQALGAWGRDDAVLTVSVEVERILRAATM